MWLAREHTDDTKKGGKEKKAACSLHPQDLVPDPGIGKARNSVTGPSREAAPANVTRRSRHEAQQ
ncbi:hypothetical protein BaRGS_00007748, partial [Batillaria attramentaria]